jgi:methyltransferase (TIGR00027 family)
MIEHVLVDQFTSQIENVTGTAFVVAEFRAEENRAKYPLYHDPVVGLFLNEHSRRAADRVAASFPPAGEPVRIRTKYFDDALEKHLRSGFRQVVILGAGLDTRAARKRAEGVTYFEIDDAATLALKRARYEQEDIAVNAKFIAGNYVTDGLTDLLRGNGFDCDAPAYFIWEGNTMYLRMDSVRDVLTELKASVRDFRLSFDYMADSVVTNTTGDAGITRLVESFAVMGAPWISGIRDMQVLARELSFNLVENVKMSDLFRAYRFAPSRTPMFSFYSVCTVG